MKKLFAGGAAALLVALGLVAGVSAPASAHTGDLNATGVCNTDTGQFDVTYTLTVSNSQLPGITYWRVGNDSFEGTPKNIAGLDRGPLAFDGPGDIELGTISVDGDSTSAPWAYAYTTWSDQYGFGSDGGDIELSGDCAVPPPVVPEKPAPEVVSVPADTLDCESTTVTTTTTTTTTDWVLIENVWVKGEPVITTASTTRDATLQECPPPPTTYQPTCTEVTGSQVITGDGVISVAGDWAEGTIAVPFTGTLADIGTVLDIDADPLQYVGLHIHTAEGTIVFEEEASYAGKLWSNSAWDGVSPGLGYAALGTIEEYIHLNGDVTVTGIDLLYTSPEASSTKITSASIGCTISTFAAEVIPPTPTPEPTPPPVPSVTTPLTTASLAHTGAPDLMPAFVMAMLGLVAGGVLIARRLLAGASKK